MSLQPRAQSSPRCALPIKGVSMTLQIRVRWYMDVALFPHLEIAFMRGYGVVGTLCTYGVLTRCIIVSCASCREGFRIAILLPIAWSPILSFSGRRIESSI